MNPATRVDNTVIFQGGYARKLTLRERFLLWLGVKTTVSAAEPPGWYLDAWGKRARPR